MDEKDTLDHLEALAQSLGLQVRYEHLESEETAFPMGGLCRVKEKQFIIVNSAATRAAQIQTFIRALRRFDLSGVYLRPALRDLLEGVSGED